MPITASRMQDVISIAVDCTEIVSHVHQSLIQIRQDIFLIEQSVDNPSDGVLDAILGIKTSIDSALMLGINPERIQNLMYEKAKFEINYKKNNSARIKMEMVRKGIHVPTPQKNPRIGNSIRPMTMAEIEEDSRQYLAWEKEQAAKNSQLEPLQLMTESVPEPEPDLEPEPYIPEDLPENVITHFTSGDVPSNPPMTGWTIKKKAAE